MYTNTTKISVSKHLLFWVCYFIFCYVSDLIVDPQSTFVAEITFYLSQNIYLFYSLYYFLRKFDATTRYSVFISLGRLMIIASIFFPIRYVLRYHFLSTYIDPTFGELPFYEWAVNGVLWILNYFFLASAYYYFTSSIAQQKILRMMIEERLKKEYEHLELENALLRAQINPHFLYNSLNFLYAKSLPLSTELSNAIMRLSEIMRYSLQAQGSDGLVSLADEIAHIRNLVEMARLRYNNGIFLELTINENVNGHKIVPLVFVTLVENVLKHGRLNDEFHPAAIRIELSERQELEFTTWNFKRTGPKEASTGIGLKNTIKRLEEAYGELCTISILDAKESFQTSIKVSLAPHTINAVT